MNILITGITGYFGNHLAQEFSQIGKIHGLKRTSSSKNVLEYSSIPIKWHDGDLNDFDSLMEALHGIDLVIHAAGLVSFKKKDAQILLHINRRGTANLVNAMLASGVKQLVHISSVAAIGQTLEADLYDENFKWINSDLTTDYGLSKYLAELEVWRGEQEGLQTMVVNPSVLLGKTGYEKSSALIYKAITEETLFFPKGNFNYIDIRDAASITRLLVEKNRWGERFILNKESIPYRKFFTLAAKIFDKRPPKIPLINWVIVLFYPIIGFFNSLGFSKNFMNKKALLSAQRPIYYSNSKVQSALNFTYRPLEETLNWAKIS
jgi:dihydroflavonol-4-reductase